LSYFAGDIITLLFKRGKFDAGAARMTAGVFSIYILSLVPATVNLPVFRMFQVIDRIKNVGVIYLFSAVNFVVFGSLLIFYLDLGVTGFAITVALNSYISQAFTFCLMHRCGIALNYRRILKYAAYSLTACLLPLVVIAILPEFTGNLVLDLLINGCIYLALVIASHLPIWKKLFGIVYTKSFS
jgi:peptidoglycan biosynthesis protein MviN/MurJ (putative lipid II flippase)